MTTSLAEVLFREYVKPHRSFTATTDDAMTLHGVHLGERGDVLLIFCHGLFSSMRQRRVPRFVESLAEHFDTIAFDFRGHGNSNGLCTFGRDEIHDLKAVVEYGRGLGYETVVAIGASMGGATVLRTAGKHGSLDGVVTIGAFADAQLLQRLHTRLTLRFVFETDVGQMLARWTRGARLSDWKAGQQPEEFAENIGVPLLVIHGEWDPLVEPAHAFRIMDHAPDPKELVILPQGGHVMSNLDHELRDLIVEWVNAEVLLKQIRKQ